MHDTAGLSREHYYLYQDGRGGSNQPRELSLTAGSKAFHICVLGDLLTTTRKRN